MNRIFPFTPGIRSIFKKVLPILAISALGNQAIAQTYCTADNTSTSSYYITSVSTTGGLSNFSNPATNFSTDGYADYTNKSVSVFQGNSVTVDAVAGPSGYTYVWAIWVDFNQDGDFDDPGEDVYVASSYTNNISANFTVPLTATPGNTRMRVRNSYYTPVPTACGSNDYGEAEDYTFEVVELPPPDNAAMGSLITPDATPFCANSYQNVSVSVVNKGLNAINSVTVGWSVDGVEQTPASFSISLPAYYDSTTVLLGSGYFPSTAPVAIKAWVYMPNGVPDTDNSDDTLQASATAALEGVEVNIQPHDTTICQGSTISLDAGTFSGNVVYIWSNGTIEQTIDVSQSGVYDVKVQNTQGCFDRDTVTVNVHPNPLVNSIALIDNGGGNFAISAIGAQNIDQYEWNFGDNTNLASGSGLPPQQNHLYTAPGTYTVTLTLSNSCGEIVTTEPVTVGSTTGIDGLSALQQQLKIFPNPAKETVTLSHSGQLKMKEISIFNVLGQNVYTLKEVNAEKQQVNTGQLAAGIYNLVVDTDKGKITKKLEIVK